VRCDTCPERLQVVEILFYREFIEPRRWHCRKSHGTSVTSPRRGGHASAPPRARARHISPRCGGNVRGGSSATHFRLIGPVQRIAVERQFSSSRVARTNATARR
jgi:hypothetical protein